LVVQGLAEEGRAALDDDAGGLKGVDLGVCVAFAAADDGTYSALLAICRFSYAS
jgi:nitrite reductase/ring-hydroxylating ferredoxin subunit